MRVELHPSNPQSAQLAITPMSSRKRLILGIPIQVNQAPVHDLAIVPGISDSLARRIVESRTSNGPFKTWSDLRRVKGIGPKKVTSLRSYLSVGLPQE
jgi:competence protein ComEA